MDVSAYQAHLDFAISSVSAEHIQLLELGCGPGNVLKYINSNYPQINLTGLDLSQSMLSLASQNVPKSEFLNMDIRHIDQIRKNYDIIIAPFCIPFLSYNDFGILIQNCSAILNKQGILYLSTMEGPPERAGFEKTSFSCDYEVYFNYYSQEQIEEQLRRCNLEVLKQITQPYDQTINDIIFIAQSRIV
jgi:cyclopropane fatty-acyl-phospholipid synthase-like methyltransferase